MSEHNRATLQNIADQAGVSKMTVSRVLRNHPNCGKETRANVQKIAKELNYKKPPVRFQSEGLCLKRLFSWFIL
jgi:DNA-binding LacI/PurR family transcriptional regulator